MFVWHSWSRAFGEHLLDKSINLLYRIDIWGLSVSGQTATIYTFMFQSCLQDISSCLWVWQIFMKMLSCGCVNTASWIFQGWYGWKYCGLKFIVLRTQHEMRYVYTFASSGESRGWAFEAQAPPHKKHFITSFYKSWESPSDFFQEDNCWYLYCEDLSTDWIF